MTSLEMHTPHASPPQVGVALEVDNLTKGFGGGNERREVITGLSFSVPLGECVSVVGPSGCGKTTLLKIVAGLMKASRGSVAVNGRKVEGRPVPELTVVLQDYARSLFPWQSVHKNVEMPLRLQGHGKTERAERALGALEAVGLAGREKLYPWQLSGGMQQRVAIARALAYRPSVLLMDEPFASVDAQTRADLEDLTLKVQRDFDMTILIVTHDIDEAVYVADRVVVLSSGPATKIDEVLVNLDRPRDQLETKASHEFVELRSRVLSNIRR